MTPKQPDIQTTWNFLSIDEGIAGATALRQDCVWYTFSNFINWESWWLIAEVREVALRRKHFVWIDPLGIFLTH